MQQYCSRVLANFCTVVLLYLASLTFVIGGGHADPPILCQRWCAYDCQSSGSAQASIQCLSNSLNCTWLAQDNANSCTLGVISKNFWVYIQISAFMRWCAACRPAFLAVPWRDCRIKVQEELSTKGYGLSFGVLLWDEEDSPGTTSGQYNGVRVHLQDACNVRVPPESCRQIGSALTFEGFIDSRSIRGVVTYFPSSILEYQGYYTSALAGIKVKVEQAVATCASAQVGTNLFDKTAAAQCIAIQLSGIALALSLSSANVPRSVAVVSGASADTFPNGLHIRVPYQFSRSGKWLSLLVIVQP